MKKWLLSKFIFIKFKFQGGFTKSYTESFVYRNVIGNFLRFISFYLPRLDKMEKTIQKERYRLKRKIGTAVVGLSVLGFGLFGVNIGDGGIVKAEHGDVPAPKLENHGDYGGAPAYDHGRPPAPKLDSHGDSWAPAFNIGDTPAPKLEAHGETAPKLDARGDTGGAPAYNIGDTPSPKLDSHGNTGGAPAYNIGEGGGAPKQEGHEHFPTPKLEAHGETI